MIAYISGEILKTYTGKDCYIDILTKSGIGYRVYTTKKEMLDTSSKEIVLYTYFHVREDTQMLFGFTQEKDRDFFEKLLTVSGVGPKLALSILSTYTRDEVENMIIEGNDTLLSKTPGLGSKGAQKIILELRGRIDLHKHEEASEDELSELKDALKALGFAGSMLSEKMDKGNEIIKKEKDLNIEDLVKQVLSA